jgi:Zn-dependent oligopeptidase
MYLKLLNCVLIEPNFGYATHAHFVLEERMAESPEKVNTFSKNIRKSKTSCIHKRIHWYKNSDSKRWMRLMTKTRTFFDGRLYAIEIIIMLLKFEI